MDKGSTGYPGCGVGQTGLGVFMGWLSCPERAARPPSVQAFAIIFGS